ncbi:BICD family-like cargo adapter 1 [Gymnodraco acuticeps]|uniref:BICD family-like cargo adapter 1 n=1 Tax=Gymnodraco acuticeps TaxID=8218 RepID=A0A6P8VIP9_GYMAC|nr:BICD family-like cargo adapter 1 [Gymnodraco acuticeps]
MNWDTQLSSILLVADGSVAKMRERLTSPGKFAKGGEDLFPTRERLHGSDFGPPALPPRSPLLRQPSPSHGPTVQWADLVAIQSQLQIQSQTIESLTQRLRDVEKERQSQQCDVQTLQEEVQQLREERRTRAESRSDHSPGAERRMEQWRREVGRELSSLRGHITRATSLGNLEESFSSKLRREELEHLRREVDQLKTQLRRQGEDAFLQQAEARETRRQYEHSCKTLEELTDSYRSHSSDLVKTVSQYSHTQQEVRQIRTTVSEMKEEFRRLILKEHQTTPLLSHSSGASPLPLPGSLGRGGRVEADSDSEDFSPTPSLAEISSDDLSWLDDKDPALHQEPRVRLSVQSTRSDFAGPGSDLDDGDDLLDEDVHPDLESDLSLADL